MTVQEYNQKKERQMAKKITGPKRPEHPFEVGKQYQNREGEYHVISINDPNMVIRYLDGRIIESTIALQARIWENMQEGNGSDFGLEVA